MIEKLIFYSEYDKDYKYSPALIGMKVFEPILKDKNNTFRHLGFIYGTHYPLSPYMGIPTSERRAYCKNIYYGDDEIPEFVLEAEKIYVEILDTPETKAVNDVLRSLEKSRIQIEQTDRSEKDEKGKWLYDTAYMAKQEESLLTMAERCAKVYKSFLETINNKSKIYGGQEKRAHTDGSKIAQLHKKKVNE